MRVHAEEAHHQRNARYRFRLRLSHKSAAAAGGTFRGSKFVAVGLQKPQIASERWELRHAAQLATHATASPDGERRRAQAGTLGSASEEQCGSGAIGGRHGRDVVGLQ